MGVMPRQVVVTNSWDDPTGRLANTSVSKENGSAPVDFIDFTYDQSGQITSQTDQRAGDGTSATDRQCYTYDHLQRLINVWTDAAGTSGKDAVGAVGACVTGSPSGATFSGPAPYWQSFSYDITGNRTEQVDHAVPGGATATTTTSAVYAGLADAHALHTATTTSTAAGAAKDTTSWAYDGGRTVSGTTTVNGTTDPNQAHRYTWNPTGTLAGLSTGPAAAPTRTTGYGYDPAGQQVARTLDGATTLSLGGGTSSDTIVLNTAGTATKILREYPFPGGSMSAVRSVTATRDVLHYQAADPQGSALSDIDSATLKTSRRTWTPFGTQRTAIDTGPGTFLDSAYRGYLGAAKDATNKISDLGARQYEFTAGRFLSVDPLLDPADPQSLNGYTYADNNPVTNTDPSGLMLMGVDGFEPASRNAQFERQTEANSAIADSYSIALNDWTTGHRATSPGSFSGYSKRMNGALKEHVGNPWDFVKWVAHGVGHAATNYWKTTRNPTRPSPAQSILQGAINDAGDCFAHGSIGGCAWTAAAVLPIFRGAKVAKDLYEASRAARAADTGPAMTIDDAQFGAKVGKHAQDYGLDPSDPAARSWVRGHIEDIRNSPDEVRQGPWNPKGGGGADYLFYRQGSDVLVTRGGGQFVTILNGGVSNGWFQGAAPR